MSAATGTSVLEVEQISKAFGGVQALSEVSLSAAAGEITAIIGDNGAGKSTVVRCISGVHRPDSGRILLEGEERDLTSPDEARRAGVETVHQDLALVEDLTVWQNFFLNREKVRRLGPLALLDRRAMQREAEEKLSRLAVNAPPVGSPVRRLSGGQRQAVALARAAGWGSGLVIMDEPTAALGVQETAKVEELIQRLRDEEGRAVLLVSHNFEQVLRLADQVWVLRAGRSVAGVRSADVSGDDLVALVTGARDSA